MGRSRAYNRRRGEHIDLWSPLRILAHVTQYHDHQDLDVDCDGEADYDEEVDYDGEAACDEEADCNEMHDLITAAIQDADEEILDEPILETLNTEPPRIAELGGSPIPDDGAEELHHNRSPYIQEGFALLLSLWCEHVGVSRSQYASLLQILLTLEDIRPIRILPSTLSALKRRFKAQFPILPLRKKKIPVVSAKLPTLSAAERQLVTSTTCWLYFQDPIALFSNMIKSPVFRESMHVGMAHFVDEPSELWESLSWASSNRSTSGEFA
jgi:hypothetical protein